MVKTTINLEDSIYEEIVKESIEKYGSTKHISMLINQRLRSSSKVQERTKKRLTFKVEDEFANLNPDAEIRKGWEGNVDWKQ